MPDVRPKRSKIKNEGGLNGKIITIGGGKS